MPGPNNPPDGSHFEDQERDRGIRRVVGLEMQATTLGGISIHPGETADQGSPFVLDQVNRIRSSWATCFAVVCELDQERIPGLDPGSHFC